MSKSETAMLVILLVLVLLSCNLLFPNVDWFRVLGLTWASIVKAWR